MVPHLRAAFNAQYTQEQYEAYMQALHAIAPNTLEFRNAETPIFVDKAFTNKMIAACEAITDVIVAPDFLLKTNAALPPNHVIDNENAHTHFIAFDFGVCENAQGELEPQLIEMQGFPTLFAFQAYHTALTRTYAKVVPPNYDAYLSGYNEATYLQLLKEIILGTHDPKHVVLLEILPEEQKTKIDFYCTKKALGIEYICLTDLIKKDNKLYYMLNGELTAIHRIYNRIIFDDVAQQNETIQQQATILQGNIEVEWCPHPNWFYRISKYTLPLITHPYVPTTYFLHQLTSIPTDLHNYVLKPLFSFAGQGVVIDVQLSDIERIQDPENWILQKKVQYANVIITPDEPAKAEIRIFYFWKDGWARPIATHNLSRISKGKMIGTRYNKDKEWVGGSVSFFEQ